MPKPISPSQNNPAPNPPHTIPTLSTFALTATQVSRKQSTKKVNKVSKNGNLIRKRMCRKIIPSDIKNLPMRFSIHRDPPTRILLQRLSRSDSGQLYGFIVAVFVVAPRRFVNWILPIFTKASAQYKGKASSRKFFSNTHQKLRTFN